jgi:hypothetical protein
LRGDVIAALRITLIANAFLEAEIDRLSAAMSSGFARGKVRKARRPKEGRRGQPPDGWQVLSAVKREAAGTLILNRLMTRS